MSIDQQQQQQQQQDGAALQQQPRPGKVQLGKFWPQAPNTWFTAAELKFKVAHINSKRERFAHAVGAMGVLCWIRWRTRRRWSPTPL